MSVLSLPCCTQAFSSCGKQGLLSFVVCGLNSCDTRTQLLCSMWDLPGPGVKPVSPALAGGFLTTGPHGGVPSTLFS